MNVSQAVARVYAEALVDMGGDDRDALSRMFDDLHAVQGLVDGDATFREFFLSPRIDAAEKKKILKALFEGKLDRPVMGLLHVLVGKRREMVLDNIVDEFDRYRDLREGRLHVHVTAAAALEDDQRQALQQKLAQATGKKIEIHEKVDPRVLGGLVVKVGDRVLDGTLRRRLERLRREMAEARG